MPRKILSEDELEDYDPSQPSHAIVQPAELLPPKKQKINSTEQKEEAMHLVGLTRMKYIRVIVDALEAHKWMDVIDRQGNVKTEWVPDIDKQRWGAEQAAKLFGDYVTVVDANVRVTHTVEDLVEVFENAKRRKLDVK